jgi:calcineurin-like phosphoesterase family protein
MSKIFVTGNMQFGRASIISKLKRPFSSLEEMHSELVSRWNSVVGPNDVVYHCGNFAWDPETAETFLRMLNGRIYLVPGENDHAILDLTANRSMPKNSVVINRIVELDEAEAVLTYWPLAAWPKQGKNYYNIHGFMNKKHLSDWKTKSCNVACDLWGFKPMEIQVVKEIVELGNQVN